MKPYQKIRILECGEPLVPIPLDYFSVLSPHPYEKLGANYRGKSPYYLRRGVVEALLKAQTNLEKRYPRWRILIFDAYRPVNVQQFMVDYTFSSVLNEQGLTAENLSPELEQEIWSQVYKIWAVPSYDLATPPPHSTGAAVDLTLVDGEGNLVDMGGEIDELSERSYPDYYAQAKTKQEQMYCQNRELLNQVMRKAGFQRHQGEWWHFSLGDQMWVFLEMDSSLVARYGRVIDDVN
ncbi:D-alanyl-D-alanine dipeptidase [Aphanothece hegewaldii CCALA 016]|uniref:D-alanyl-D-alanine dipeptidase n=1 Tax=Aphanothece hegewaldii CCALA 016 TaxID=2107694 RepID=A0A2T1M1K6_9CHRO|nr:M15 family metallopeptidase [Aphanothece hegewaldii]PSF38592.1 D-alanyl-D-alanine dipeptidase [Aphanothece hegewaldii CCALA 016]